MRREITVRKTTRGQSDELDREFWARVTPDERFAEAWRLRFPIIGIDALMKNKQALARPKDLVDLDLLRRHHPR
jgi:hypothetical protein